MSEEKSISLNGFNFDDFYKSLGHKEKYYYNKIDEFFKGCSKSNITMMIDIINSNSKISLRILDWFITKYSDQYKIRYKNKRDNDGSYFNVHASYVSQLGSYKKQYFDPFRRYCKFWYNYDKKNDEKVIYTTIGQLNFFKWAIEYDVLDFIDINYDKLIAAMNKSNKDMKEKKIKDNDTKSNTTTLTKTSIVKTTYSDTNSLIISFE